MTGQPLLEVDGLTIEYGGLRAVDRASLRLHADQVVSLIGPNGAGKTSLFNSITGYVQPAAGRVTFLGDDITGRDPVRIARSGLNRTFQKTSFFPDLTVWGNLQTAALEGEIHRGSGGRVRSVHEDRVQARAARVMDLVDLGTRRDDQAAVLPYGAQRRLGIGLAVAMAPAVLLLDEPCAGMNASEIQELILLIARLRETGIAMVVVEHQMRFVMGISDRVMVLHHGQMLAEGSPAEVTSNPAVIEAYLGRQGGGQ